jgi:myotubularin-related protein 6/7/8
MAQAVHKRGASVLLHCEEDADTVSVLAALVKLCLDPYYRTRKGFQVLIEEDWLAFGFRFADRCGQLVRARTRNTPGGAKRGKERPG